MPNQLTLTVENPDDILNAGAYGAGAVIRLQSATLEAGPFADVAGTGSTPTLAVVTAIRSYSGFDPNGTSSTWYRSRLENAAATRASDWSAAFQVGDETAGLICSLYDVQQALGDTATNANRDELILDTIRQVSTSIMDYTGRRFVRSPLSGEAQYLFDVRFGGRTLWIPQGIASASLLEVAFQTGATFQIVTAADWFLDPPAQSRTYGWPATRISLSDVPTGSVPFFYPGKRVVRVTMALGFVSVPADVQGVAIRAVTRRYLGKGGGGVSVAVGPAGTEILLPDMSGADRAVLDFYRVRPV